MAASSASPSPAPSSPTSSPASPASPSSPATPPNFVIFMPDQLRFDALGCTQDTAGTAAPDALPPLTPNIDAFRRRGTLFTECYVQASVCSQSRCSMFTGTYPHVSGHRSLDNLIKPWEPNLFRSLREHGYHVACLAPRGDTFAPTVTELSLDEYGFIETPEFAPNFPKNKTAESADAKSSPAPDSPPDADIWARLFYRGRRPAEQSLDYDEAVIRSATAWLECPPTGRPWVLFLPLIFPHCPFTVEEPYFSRFDRDRVGDVVAEPARKTGREPRYMEAIRGRYGTQRATPAMWREVKATYYGMVARLDDQFGRLIARIDALGLWRDTVTLFFTDHGEYLGDHGLIEKWPSALSASLVREPLIVAGAGLPAGRTVSALTEMVDLVPTLFELAGIPEHFPHNGTSWVKLLRGETDVHKPHAFSEGGFLTSEEPLLEQAPFPYDIKAAMQHDDTALVGKAIAVRDHHWTFVYRLYEEPELYSRADDPHEMHNLADRPDQKERVAAFQDVVFRWLFATADLLPLKGDPRWPKTDMTPPRVLLEERLRQAGKEWEVVCR